MIAYGAFVTGGVSTQGIFRTDGTQTVAIADDNTLPPTGGTFLFFGSPAINEGGQVAFVAGMTGGSADFGIYSGDGETHHHRLCCQPDRTRRRHVRRFQ